MKNGQKKMKLKLRTVALIDEGFTKASDQEFASHAHTNETIQERERTIHNKSLKEKAEERERQSKRENPAIRSLKRKVGY